MSSVERYKVIWEKKALHPDKSISELCREQGVSYQSYNLWRKKQQEAPTSALASGVKMLVQVPVSVRDMVNYMINNVTQLAIPIKDVLRAMKPEDQKKVAIELGKRQLEGILQEAKDGSGHA